MDLLLNVRHDGNETTVDVGGEIDLCSGQRLLRLLLDIIRERGPVLAVDLAGVTFMDCGGVRVLLAVRSRARRLGGRLSVVAVSPPAHRVLAILNLDTVLVTPTPSTMDDQRGEELQRWHCFLPAQAERSEVNA